MNRLAIRQPSWLTRDSFFTAVDPLFDEMFNSMLKGFNASVKSVGKHAYPKTDVYFEGDDLVLESFVPYAKENDLEVNLGVDRVLTIIGEAFQQAEESPERRYIQKEIRRSKFIRKFVFEKELYDKITTIDTTLEGGVLSIRFKGIGGVEKPKTPEVYKFNINDVTEVK